jgi:hypothetical protein
MRPQQSAAPPCPALGTTPPMPESVVAQPISCHSPEPPSPVELFPPLYQQIPTLSNVCSSNLLAGERSSSSPIRHHGKGGTTVQRPVSRTLATCYVI